MEKELVELLSDKRLAFYASLALRMKVVRTSRVKTMGTDGVSVFINPEWYDNQNRRQKLYGWCHEVLHPALGHNARKSGRNHHKWNEAGDAAIASALLDLERVGKIQRPDGIVTPVTLGKPWDLNAEQYYEQMEEEDEPESTDDNESGGGDSGDNPDDTAEEPSPDDASPEQAGDEPNGGDETSEDSDSTGGSGENDTDIGDGDTVSQDEEPDRTGAEPGDVPALGDDAIPFDEADVDIDPAELEERWSNAVIEAVAQAESQAGDVPGWATSAVESIRKTHGPNWKQVLRQFCRDFVKARPSFSRPNRRHLHRGIILPDRRRDPNIKKLAVYCDSSGSHGDTQIASVLAQVERITQVFDRIEIEVCWWDTRVVPDKVYTKRDFPISKERIKVYGRGGTKVQSVFDHIAQLSRRPDAVIIATDGFVYDYPKQKPPYPVLWCMTTKYYSKPGFGQIVEVKS